MTGGFYEGTREYILYITPPHDHCDFGFEKILCTNSFHDLQYANILFDLFLFLAFFLSDFFPGKILCYDSSNLATMPLILDLHG